MKGKVSILGALSFSLGLIALAIFSQISFSPKETSAALAAERCFDYNRYSIGTCGCHDYACYTDSVLYWNGGSLPTNDAVRAGTWCDNGYGYDVGSGNEWGDRYAGCGLYR
ncbi:MAG: hypothetical protein NDI62_01895 [Burkholderiales bacterium]|nr:hypothetical protein [Burkholderiales bacterium]